MPLRRFSIFTTASVILLAGCGVLKKSPTWETVRAVPRTGPGFDAPDAEYAKRLHGTLHAAHVEHKVVTFAFRYQSRILLDREGEETAVIYRDTATPSNPWWLMSERLTSPVWLPTEPVASQIAFYISRPADLVKVEEYPEKIAAPAVPHRHAGRHRSHRPKPRGKRPKGSHHSGN